MQSTSLGVKLPRKRRLSGALLSSAGLIPNRLVPLRHLMVRASLGWSELNGGYPDVTVELFHR